LDANAPSKVIPGNYNKRNESKIKPMEESKTLSEKSVNEVQANKDSKPMARERIHDVPANEDSTTLAGQNNNEISGNCGDDNDEYSTLREDPVGQYLIETYRQAKLMDKKELQFIHLKEILKDGVLVHHVASLIGPELASKPTAIKERTDKINQMKSTLCGWALGIASVKKCIGLYFCSHPMTLYYLLQCKIKKNILGECREQGINVTNSRNGGNLVSQQMKRLNSCMIFYMDGLRRTRDGCSNWRKLL
jgi:hypothetical protein